MGRSFAIALAVGSTWLIAAATLFSGTNQAARVTTMTAAIGALR